MGSMVTRKCACCGAEMQVRATDVKRGWGKFCSKRCKAVKQEQRTGQHKAHAHRQRVADDRREYGGSPQYDRNGEYIGFTMTQAELAGGGYGDADEHAPLGDGKW